MCEQAEIKVIQRLFQGIVSESIDRCLESQLVEKVVEITEKKAFNENISDAIMSLAKVPNKIQSPLF